MVATRALIFAGVLFLIVLAIWNWLALMPNYFLHYQVSTCTSYGISAECLPGIPQWDTFSNTGHMLLFIALVSIGLLTVYPLIAAKMANKAQPIFAWSNMMTLNLAAYAVITGFFALFRAKWGLGRPLLVGAALHNLGEWLFLAQVLNPVGNSGLVHPKKDDKTNNDTAASDHQRRQFAIENTKSWSYLFIAWISFLCVLIMVLPRLELAVVAEQAAGILPDYALPILLAYFVLKSTNDEVSTLFWPPFLAFLIHIFLTIIPLVLANLSVGITGSFFYINESGVYISAVVTHWLLKDFAKAYDERVNMARFGTQQTTTMVETLVDNDFNATAFYLPQLTFPGWPKWSQIKKLITSPIGIVFLCCLMMGFATVILTPFSKPQIHLSQDGNDVDQYPQIAVTGTSVAVLYPGLAPAFIDRIRSHALISNARRFEGNIEYSLFQNKENPFEFRFIETWASMEALQQWLASPTPTTTFFHDDMLRNMMRTGNLQQLAGYSDTAPILTPAAQNNTKPAMLLAAIRAEEIVTSTLVQAPSTKGGVRWTVGQECDAVMNVLSNWQDCTWVEGCVAAHIDAKDPSIRRLVMKNGDSMDVKLVSLDKDANTLRYHVLNGPIAGYTGTITLYALIAGKDPEEQQGDQCGVSYVFQVQPNTATVEAVYQDFVQNRVPFLKQLFQNN